VIQLEPSEALLKEVLQYLTRSNRPVPGIGASYKTGELEGPEQDRFLLAEKVKKFLDR
jgi:hypothetical protein